MGKKLRTTIWVMGSLAAGIAYNETNTNRARKGFRNFSGTNAMF